MNPILSQDDFSDESLTNRGSCTCNLITNDHIDYLADKIGGVSTEQDWINLVAEVENGIKIEISDTTETNYEVFFGPSGTDVVYFPLLFLHGKTIFEHLDAHELYYLSTLVLSVLPYHYNSLLH